MKLLAGLCLLWQEDEFILYHMEIFARLTIQAHLVPDKSNLPLSECQSHTPIVWVLLLSISHVHSGFCRMAPLHALVVMLLGAFRVVLQAFQRQTQWNQFSLWNTYFVLFLFKAFPGRLWFVLLAIFILYIFILYIFVTNATNMSYGALDVIGRRVIKKENQPQMHL